jgi:hypothetical protein
MSNWEGMGKRESPEKILARLRRANDDSYDVEVALSEFIAALENIHHLKLQNFDCGDAIIDGLAKLNKKYTLTWRDAPTSKHVSEFRHLRPSHLSFQFVKE